MATKRKSSGKQRFVNNSLVRVLGQHRPVQQVLQEVAQNSALPIQVRTAHVSSAMPATTDYILIDPALTIETVATAEQAAQTMPPMGVGYAAFTAGQRYALLQWLNQPTEPAPPAFQQFYLAQLEVGLLEQTSAIPLDATPVPVEIVRLQQSPAWHSHPGLARLRLLADWLAQDGRDLPTWLPEQSVSGPWLGVALGLQALLKQALVPQQLPMLLQQWAIGTLPNNTLLTLRLSSLAATLGTDPLAYALAQVDEEARLPQPWRSQHRDLRLVLPQPNLRPSLEPLLRDLVVMQDETKNEPSPPVMDAGTTAAAKGTAKWQLVLEFGESRSDLFTFALTIAQQQAGYVALLDEDRRMVHRVHFQKSELRRFWRLWEYVQSWSTTKVYLNGNEVNKWELYARL